MPWGTTTVSEQRVRFIRDYQRRVLTKQTTMSGLCHEHGVSRKTGYKMIRRHEQNGWPGLADESRAPRAGEHWSTPDMVMLVLETRLDFPEWGAKKIVAYLGEHEPEIKWPAPSVAHEWIRRAGLIEKHPRSRRFPHPGKPPAIVLTRPNQQWSVDFKGHFRTRDRRYCYPLTGMDSFSRYLLCCEGMLSTSFDTTWPAFERLFREYGLPDSILSDNGTPFSSNSVKRLSKLSVRWIRLGITPRLIEPGKPQQNGQHERMHRDLKEVACANPAENCERQQPIFDTFDHRYNYLRPHESLGQKTPSSLYKPSERTYPNKLPEIEYPDHFEVRRVRSSGEIRWDGQWFFLSEALVGERIGFQRAGHESWIILFGPIELGYYSNRDKTLHLDRSRPAGKAEK
jgi:transposase InsO family protein